ncbi:MAG: NifB/NifX family molybdenum-iron cluster-binding protein [Desulfococcaceae bacterium]|jgi:predicted Fe-Mo cluster-binding NifX family protein|nr:NifB/NifX family molybdenum-iron cluster-binding protein [Desulfococcaceae bacterium]
MDKIAITCSAPDLDAQIDPRFGRAAGFLVIDPETMIFEYLENGTAQLMPQGAGIQAAETVAGSGAKTVLTGFVGPKAFQALSAAGIRVGQNLENISARKALELFQNGKVEISDAPNSSGGGGKRGGRA